MSKALPDQRVALEKLVAFDQARVAHWKAREDKSQKVLESTVQHDLKTAIKTSSTVAELQAEIGMLQASVDNMKQKTAFKVARLTEKLHELENVIKQDIALDKKRANNAIKENNLANSSKVVAESAL